MEMELDPIFLARIQFAFTVSFHIIFPSFSIGLASYLAVLEGLWLKTGNNLYKELYKFWIKIFAVTFGMGVVSGVVMAYQFGTNWSVFSDKISNVIGPLLGYEVLTAFFLEASFLGVMLFGWGRVSKNMHFFSTCIVAIGTMISAFWILSANSWMQTPTGFYVNEIDQRLYPTNWIDVIFNPSFPYRLAHMLTASFLTTSFVVGGVAAIYLIQKRFQTHAKLMLSMATFMAIIVTPVQIFLGDLHGLNTLDNQPLKVAAMEGIWETEKGAGLRLFAIPDQKEEKNHYEISIPYLGSLILTHSFDGKIKGMNEWSKENHPPVAVVFWSFRVMVGIGFLMLILGILSTYLYFKNKLHLNKPILRFWIFMIPSGFIATLAGWFVTEVGRQPYTVYGVIRTFESVSPSIIAPQVLFSLIAFIIVYAFIFGAAIFYMCKLVRIGIKIIDDKEQFYAHGIEASIFQENKRG
jgi:cytochrome d ubiquinol oxidase subunit I